MIQRWPYLLAITGLFLAWAGGAAAQKGGPPPALVKITPVIQKQVEAQITLTGTAEPHRYITLASPVEEIVAQDLVEEGDQVKAGQVVVRLDDRRLRLRLAEAQASLRENQALEAQYRRDLARIKKLYQNRTVPLSQLEEAQTKVTRQLAVVQRNRESVRLLKHDIAQTAIRSPVDAVVIKRIADKGEWVTKGGTVAELSVINPLKVVVKVPERYLKFLKLGQKLPVSADALPGCVSKGTITAIIPSGDQQSRTFPVQLRVPNPGCAIKPGMLIRATFAVGDLHPALLVPKDALVLSALGQSVYVLRQSKAYPVSVRVVASHDSLVEVEGDLKAGQQVVTIGNERLFPGQPVKVIKR